MGLESVNNLSTFAYTYCTASATMTSRRFHPTEPLQAAQRRLKLVARTAQLLLVLLLTCILCIAFALRPPVRSSFVSCDYSSTDDVHALNNASASIPPPAAKRLLRRQVVVSRLWENVSWLLNSELASEVPVAVYQLVDGNFTQHELNCPQGWYCPRTPSKCRLDRPASTPQHRIL